MKTAYPANDTEFRTHTLRGVRKDDSGGWWLELDNGWSFYCPPSSLIVPEKGMVARLYGPAFGIVRGLFINGASVFYRTEEEQERQNKQDLLDHEMQQRKIFEDTKQDYFIRIAKLPQVFQDRMSKFQHTNPDFDWKFGQYELFCCEQAVLMSDFFKTEDALLKWARADYQSQKIQFPALSDQHSGNTFGTAVTLAHWYLIKPENVVMEHGALVPLVGCVEYGCPHCLSWH